MPRGIHQLVNIDNDKPTELSDGMVVEIKYIILYFILESCQVLHRILKKTNRGAKLCNITIYKWLKYNLGKQIITIIDHYRNGQDVLMVRCDNLFEC